jgi:predicted nucleic acid-binding protein
MWSHAIALLTGCAEQELGRPAGDMDVLIAATALTAGQVLVSDNASHFADIPELLVETY